MCKREFIESKKILRKLCLSLRKNFHLYLEYKFFTRENPEQSLKLSTKISDTGKQLFNTNISSKKIIISFQDFYKEYQLSEIKNLLDEAEPLLEEIYIGDNHD